MELETVAEGTCGNISVQTFITVCMCVCVRMYMCVCVYMYVCMNFPSFTLCSDYFQADASYVCCIRQEAISTTL